MPVLESKLNPRSADYLANAAAMQALVDDLRSHCEKLALGGSEDARKKHTDRGSFFMFCIIILYVDVEQEAIEFVLLDWVIPVAGQLQPVCIVASHFRVRVRPTEIIP